MKELLIVLIFGKTILLTPSPILIGPEWVDISISKQLVAINEGASVLLDISSLPHDKDLQAVRKEIDAKYPKGSVKGQLVTNDGVVHELFNVGLSWNKKATRLILSSEQPIPKDIHFVKVRLRSEYLIETTYVYWKNHSL